MLISTYNCLFVKSSWYLCNTENTNFCTLKKRDYWYDKSYIVTPVNINDCHWNLVVVCPIDKIMYNWINLGKKL